MNIVNEPLRRRLIEFFLKNKHELFALFACVVAANLWGIYYVRQEHSIYYWDQAHFWLKFRYLCEHVSQPINLLKTIIYSIREDDYNYLPPLLLAPFGLLFGTERLPYILSIVNIFVVPAGIIFVLLHERMCRRIGITSSFLPYVAVANVLLLPNFWQPILSGYPDVGGILIIYLILLIFLRHPFSEQRMRDLILIAVLISCLILFRRWYAYWGVAFYIALILNICLMPFVTGQFDIRGLASNLFKACALIFISGIFLFLVAPTFSSRMAGTNYADVYSAYRNDFNVLHAFVKLLSRFGLFFFLVFILGGSIALRDKRTRGFAVFLLLQWATIFILFARTQDFGRHHCYLLMPTMLFFSALFCGFVIDRLRNLQVLTMGVLFLIFIFNFISGFTRGHTWPEELRPQIFTSFRQPPSVRNDLSEISRMLGILEKLVLNSGDRVYALASSENFNCETLINAYLTLGQHKAISKEIYWTKGVDKRDGFPQDFLTATYVVVGSPIQYHLRPSDQRIIGIPAEMVLMQKDLGTAFEKLPYRFNLDGDVTVSIYKRTRPFTHAEGEFLSTILKSYYPDRKNIFNYKKS